MRGWVINDGDRVLNSNTIENDGVICIDEPNIDDKSFNNEYIYNEESQTYQPNISRPNQVSFSLKFKITKFGEAASNTIVELKKFFDQVGKRFTITRTVNQYPNMFIVDSFATSHITTGGDYIDFEVSCSYVGDYFDYEMIREHVVFDGEHPVFQFDHRFAYDSTKEDPERTTVFDLQIANDFIKDLQNLTTKSIGVYYHVTCLETMTYIRFSNLTYDETIIINYGFEEGDIVVINTEPEEPAFLLTRGNTTTNLLPYIDFSQSSFPMLYQGPNEIRVDLRNGLTPVDGSRIYAEYWNRKESNALTLEEV